MALTKRESLEAATAESITPGNYIPLSDLGSNKILTTVDADGTVEYEVVTSQSKIGSKSLRLKATQSIGRTIAVAGYSIPSGERDFLSEDTLCLLFARRSTTSTNVANRIFVRITYNDNETTRQIVYYIDQYGAYGDATLYAIDKTADFSQDTWGVLKVNLYADFVTAFESYHQTDNNNRTVRDDLSKIKVTAIEMATRHEHTADAATECYFDYFVINNVDRLQEPEISEYNILCAGENDLKKQNAFTFDPSGTTVLQENPAGIIQSEAEYNAGTSYARIGLQNYANSDDIANTKTTTFLFYFKAVAGVGTEASGRGISFLHRSSDTGEYFNITIFNDGIKDNVAITKSSSTGISNGSKYYVRIVLTHGASGTGTGNVYFNGSETPFAITSASTGSANAIRFGAISTVSGISKIQILAAKYGTGTITDENIAAQATRYVKQHYVHKVGPGDYRCVYIADRHDPAPPADATTCFFLETSSDGKTFTPYGTQPIFIPSVEGSGKGDEHDINTPFYIVNGGTHYLFYSGYTSGGKFQIFVATSPDGYVWTRGNGGDPILTFGGVGADDEGGVLAPHVVVDGSNFRMFYSDSNYKYMLLATSTTAIDSGYVKDGTLFGVGDPGDPDDGNIVYGRVRRKASNDWEMYYAGYDGSKYTVCRKTSTAPDSGWSSPGVTVFDTAGSYAWDQLYCNPGSLIEEGNELWLYYFGRIDLVKYIGMGKGISANGGASFYRATGLIIENKNPDYGETVSASDDIYFELDDGLFPVKKATLDVDIKVNAGGWVNAIVNGVFQSGYTGSIVSDGVRGYNVTIDPDVDFNQDDTINVKIDVQNEFEYAITDYQYSYTVQAFPATIGIKQLFTTYKADGMSFVVEGNTLLWKDNGLVDVTDGTKKYLLRDNVFVLIS